MANKDPLAKQLTELANKTAELAEHTDGLAKTIRRIDAKRHWAVYSHPWRFFIFSFLNGLFIILGSTLGLAFVIYLLGIMGYIPVFGTFFAGLREALY